jgi:hypothetical protein
MLMFGRKHKPRPATGVAKSSKTFGEALRTTDIHTTCSTQEGQVLLSPYYVLAQRNSLLPISEADAESLWVKTWQSHSLVACNPAYCSHIAVLPTITTLQTLLHGGVAFGHLLHQTAGSAMKPGVRNQSCLPSHIRTGLAV